VQFVRAYKCMHGSEAMHTLTWHADSAQQHTAWEHTLLQDQSLIQCHVELFHDSRDRA